LNVVCEIPIHLSAPSASAELSQALCLLDVEMEANSPCDFFSAREVEVNMQQFLSAVSVHSDDGVRLIKLSQKRRVS
jgi:hypothetical protein